MTIEKTYRCDVCGNSTPDKTGIIGVYWTGGNVMTTDFPGIRDANTHVCRTCLDGLVKIQKALPSRPTEAKPCQD